MEDTNVIEMSVAIIICTYKLNLFNSLSERPLSKLSENHKINVIGPSELKLWPFYG